MSAPPIIVGGRILVYDNRQVVAYSTGNGSVLWSSDTLGEEADAPVGGGGLASDGQRIYVATGASRLLALDVQSGSLIWSAKLSEPARSAPAVAGNRNFDTERLPLAARCAAGRAPESSASFRAAAPASS